MKKPFPYQPYPPSKPIEPAREIVEWVIIFEERLEDNYSGPNKTWQEFQAAVQAKIPSNNAPEDFRISVRTDKCWYYDDCTVEVFVVIKQKQIKQKSDHAFNKEMKVYKKSLERYKTEYDEYKRNKIVWDAWEKEQKRIKTSEQYLQLEKRYMKSGKETKKLENMLTTLKAEMELENEKAERTKGTD